MLEGIVGEEHYRGEVVIGSMTYELAAWKRTKQGTTKQFVSGKLTIKAPKEDPGAYRGGEEAKTTSSEAPKASADAENVPF